MTATPSADVPAEPPRPIRSLGWTVPWAMVAALGAVTLVQHPPQAAASWRAAGFFVVLLVLSLLMVVLLLVRAIRSVRPRREFVARWSAAARAGFARARYAREEATPPLVLGALAAVAALTGAVLVLVFAEQLASRSGGLSSAAAVTLLLGMLAVRMLESGLRRRRASRPA